jgi:hypothetical protein
MVHPIKIQLSVLLQKLSENLTDRKTGFACGPRFFPGVNRRQFIGERNVQ